MSQSYIFNPKQLRNIVAPVHSLTVETGSIVVSKHEEFPAASVEAGDTLDTKGMGGLSVFSPDSATVTVNFSLEAAPPEAKKLPSAKKKTAAKKRNK